MEVIVARTAGFCFGVKRAVETAFEETEKAAEQNIPVYTFGEIIHNETVTGDLLMKGAKILNSLDDIKSIPKDSIVIIRSHGVERKVYDVIKEHGCKIVDATCPFVSNIHRIVSEKSKTDQIIIVGNPDHAEVVGIKGHCLTEPFIIKELSDVENLPSKIEKTITVVSQTTFNLKKFEEIVEFLCNKYYNVIVSKTICSATEERQTEARQLASDVDAMIVIGGRNSSNTQKLYEISRQQCNNTYYIQTLDDLDLTALESVSRVGITAGASTPNKIIKEVQKACQK